jgi:glycosyltransferase involved in cell wall biosynthesis
MNDVLLTVSGRIAPDVIDQIANGNRPAADYIAMAQAFQADLIDYNQAHQTAGLFGRLLEKVGGPNLLLAWNCYLLRKRYRVLFTDGEQVGLPLAFFLKFMNIGKRPRHLMIAHILSVRKKIFLLDWLRLASHIDVFFAYSTWQKNFIAGRWKLPPEKVQFTPFMVDANFFSPHQAKCGGYQPPDPGRPLICAVGLEFRDYPTLIQAVKGLELQVVIAAASPWSKRTDTTTGQEIPDNVTVQRFTQYELRDLYAASRFIVLPLYNVNFQAGITSILEGMAMEKAVICSRTPGQTDAVIENETGIYVPPENSDALREAIIYLLENPHQADQFGKKGRQVVLEHMSLDCYVDRLLRYVQV